MPRRARPLINGGCYHIIARGNNRQHIFQDSEAFRHFLRCLANAKSHYPAKLYHYCLMTNHIHFLLEILHGHDLPKFMQAVLQGYGRWHQKRIGYTGHVWQGRYKSPLISRESYFLEAGRYIERNPLRAGMIADLKDYRWSSYPHYAYGSPDHLLDEDPYYSDLASTAPHRQAIYREFVRIANPYDAVLDQEFIGRSF